MTEKIKILAITLMLAAGLMLGAGMLGGLLGYQKGLSKCDIDNVSDTVYVPDTIEIPSPPDTVLVAKIVKIKVPVLATDSSSAPVDSAEVELPMEWHLAHVPDTADVWYHGVMAAVDSMRFYFKNTTITNTITKTEWKTPRLTLNLGVGAICCNNATNPYLVGEVRYNAKKTTFSAFGAVNQEGKWCAGGNVTYRFNILK